MTHGSLFSGIGGFDLAAEWMGWENVFHCEWNPFGQRVLHHYWPNAIQYTDITKTDFKPHANTIDILTGGFPCQPYSSAGKRKGKDDERHLWPQMCRAIKEIAPRFVVGENVRGLTNWNGGLVFDEVCTDLENLGYKVAPVLIPACATNAPHKRERIWFVAYSNHSRTNVEMQDKRPREESYHEWERQPFVKYRENGIDGDATDTLRIRFGNSKKTRSLRKSKTTTQSKGSEFTIGIKTNDSKCKSNWRSFPTQSAICSGDDGISTQLDGITFSKWRNQSIKAYGNAIVPNVAFEIFKAIQQYETTYNR